MAKLRWNSYLEETSYDHDWDQIHVAGKHIQRGMAPALLSHEIAHWKYGPEPSVDSFEEFVEEVNAWKVALQRTPKEYVDKKWVTEGLNSYLEGVSLEYGEGSPEYIKAFDYYQSFKRKYL